VAAAADALEPVADAAAAAADLTAGPLDVTAAGLDETAAGVDETAAGLDATAAGEDATAITADEAAAAANEKAAASDEAAAAADERAAAAVEAATAANEAASAADEKAVKADNLATAAGVAATAADIAFTQEVGKVENILSVGQTQNLAIADQLNAGVRSLDLRGTQVNDTINLNQGQYFTGATLQSALDDMTSFLQANPTETIVVSLSSNEDPGGPINSANSFNTDLNNLLNSSDTAVPGSLYKDFMYYSSTPTATPTLGQVRGKIVIMPAVGDPWTPVRDKVTGQTLGWKPTQVVQESPTVIDPAARWNLAENNGDNTAGLIPTDLGNPNTLYRNNLSVTGTTSQPTIQQGDGVNAIAEVALASVHVTRTTGIVGMDDPDANLIAAIVNENNLPIMVTSATDAAGDPNNLRAAITQANSQPGVNTIEFAPNLNGPPGQTIILLSDLPAVTGDTNIVGPATIVTQHHLAFQHAPTHTVTEVNFVASDSGPLTQVPTTYTPPLYVNTSNLTIYVTVAQQHAVLLEGQINALVSAGALSSGNGNALVSKLSSAAANFASGNPNAGINDLHAFINAVNSYATQTPPLLTAAEAQTLISAANAVIALAMPIQLVSSVGTTVTAGTPFNLTLTAIDVWGNVLPTFTGTVKFTDSVAGATLPGNYTFTTGTGQDNGVHTFTGLVLTKKGVQTITIADAKGKVLASLTVNVV
jgi:1-phosphatidylinositol phosphodiesterase